ncbi:MAG TPA: hypothetical protein VJ023_09725 [Pyrinomonadaceae bacterium]|nr:hypothetical protein [Pyrinomonadaceae bacterium]
MRADTFLYRSLTFLLRLGLVAALFTAGWFVYLKVPHSELNVQKASTLTNLQIVLQPEVPSALDIRIELYPVDLVAARHEYFAERREGKRFEEFLRERMRGRTPVSTRLDVQGETTVAIAPGNWWVHALLPGSEDLEWRLPITVTGDKQTVSLTPQNAYTRTKSF